MIRIALPNKGSLSDEAGLLVKQAGYSAKREAKALSVLDRDNDIEFLFLRPRDIAVYVAGGIVDLGITGRDLLMDANVNAKELLPLSFGKSRFTYAVPENSDITSIDMLDGKRIASSYPNIVKADMEKRGCAAKVVKLDGAVEISIRLGVADAIADVVESGATMRQAGLRPLGESIMNSEAILITGSQTDVSQPQIATFLKRVNGILTARTYVVIEYDVEQKFLEAACAVTPCYTAPTVSPLSQSGWYAVKSMVKRKELNATLDRIEAAGGQGIIVTDIKTCRI